MTFIAVPCEGAKYFCISTKIPDFVFSAVGDIKWVSPPHITPPRYNRIPLWYNSWQIVMFTIPNKHSVFFCFFFWFTILLYALLVHISGYSNSFYTISCVLTLIKDRAWLFGLGIQSWTGYNIERFLVGCEIS